MIKLTTKNPRPVDPATPLEIPTTRMAADHLSEAEVEEDEEDSLLAAMEEEASLPVEASEAGEETEEDSTEGPLRTARTMAKTEE